MLLPVLLTSSSALEEVKQGNKETSKHCNSRSSGAMQEEAIIDYSPFRICVSKQNKSSWLVKGNPESVIILDHVNE